MTWACLQSFPFFSFSYNAFTYTSLQVSLPSKSIFEASYIQNTSTNAPGLNPGQNHIKECRTQMYFHIIQSAMGTQILSSNFFDQLKWPSTRLQRVFKSNLDTLDSKNLYARNPNHSRGSSVPLKYIVDIYSSMLKKLWVQHCKTSKFWQK